MSIDFLYFDLMILEQAVLWCAAKRVAGCEGEVSRFLARLTPSDDGILYKRAG